jgi:hypothetical protein
VCGLQLNSFKLSLLAAVSALDLGISSPGLAFDLEWSARPNLRGNDHHSLNLHISTPFAVLFQHLNWIIRHVDWAGFCQLMGYED